MPQKSAHLAFYSKLLLSFSKNEPNIFNQYSLKYTEPYVALFSFISIKPIHLKIFLNVPLSHISSSDNILKACFATFWIINHSTLLWSPSSFNLYCSRASDLDKPINLTSNFTKHDKFSATIHVSP